MSLTPKFLRDSELWRGERDERDTMSWNMGTVIEIIAQ
jgi:hypothetical protein